jgi:hypothetical protein
VIWWSWITGPATTSASRVAASGGLVAAVESARSASGRFYVDVDLLDAQGRPVERVLVSFCPDWLTVRRR